jgi:iron complex outermembrane receptor protein
MRELYLSLAFLFLIFQGSVAQSKGKIQGQVTSSDGNPVEYVSIQLKGTSRGAVTGNSGSFEITGLNPGSYTLVASFVGLDTQEKPVVVTAGQAEVVNFILTENSGDLQEILVSASREGYTETKISSSLRVNAPLIEIPQNIQVVNRDMLNDQQVISMSDGLVRNVSGAVRLEHWGDLYTNISARGSQVQALRNGFNVVTSYWGPLTEDMSFVERIEFVKGPAGFMLSSGDGSGLYNVVTKKPTGQTGGEVSFTMGSFDLYRTAVDLDGKLSKDGRLLYRLNVAGQQKKSHRPFEHNNRYTLAPVISYRIQPSTLATFEYTYQRADMSDVGSYYVFSPDGFATLPLDFTALPPGMPDTKINDHAFTASLQHEFSPNWKLTAQATHMIYNQQGSSMWPSAVNPDGTILRAVSSWDALSKMTMAQVFVNGEFRTGDIRHKILSGLDMSNKSYWADWGQYHVLDSIGAEFDPKNPYYGVPVNGYPNFDFSTPIEERAQAAGGTIDQRYSAFYFQDELAFMEDRLRLTLAARYTEISQSVYGGAPVTDSHVTPRVGLSASVTPNTSVYALYDQAFMPQSGRLSNGGDVKPITGNNMELGLKRDWANGKWSTTLAAYKILKRNELTGDPNSPPNSGLSIELGEKTAEGIEFDLKGSILPGLNMTLNYAYTDSRVTKVTENVTVVQEGDIIPGYARNTFNTWLGYTIQNGTLEGLGFSAGLTILGGRETYWDVSPDPNEVLPTYTKVDAGIFWGKGDFKVNLNVFNLLDEYLYSGSYYSWLNAYNWQTDPPRNSRLSVSYKF